MPIPESPQISGPTRPLLRSVLFVAGVGATALGILGIFLPLLPTVPLLLLAVARFARSSERCYRWLLDHPRLGPLVAGYLDGDGVPLRAKVIAIATLWLSVSFSLYLAAPSFWVRLLLPVIAAGVTLYLLRLPTRDPRDSDS